MPVPTQPTARLIVAALLAATTGLLPGQEWPVPVEPAVLGLAPVRAAVPAGAGGEVGGFVGLATQAAAGADPAAATDRMILPFARPVAHVDLARYVDGTVIVLAGGIESDLQIYRLGPDHRSVAVMEGLAGRRRVAESFQGGRGAWPARIDRGLFVTVCEGAEQPELRAWADDGRSVIEPRLLPVSVSTLSIVWNSTERRALVLAYGRPDEELAAVDILHPVMPELAFEGFVGVGVLAFEESAVDRVATLVNRGRVDFEGSILTDAPDVELGVADGPLEPRPDCKVAAGDRVAVRIRWRGPAVAERVATLSVQGSYPGVGARLRLRWVPAAASVAAPSAAPTDPSAGAEPGPGEAVVDQGESAADPSAAPRPVESVEPAWILGWAEQARLPLELQWTRPGRVRAELWLVGSGPGAATVRLRNARTGSVVAGRVDPGAARPVVLEIDAAAFDDLELLPAERGFPVAAVPIGKPKPVVEVDGDHLVVTAAPHATVLLAEGLGIPLVPISLREGRADPMGRFRVSCRALGTGVGAVTVVVADPATGRVYHTGPLLLPQPSGAIRVGSGGDRGN